MGTKFNAVALEGDFCDRLAEIARACGRCPEGTVQLFSDWSSVAPFVSRPGYLGAARSGGWTVFMDDWDLTAYIFDHPDVAEAITRRFNTRVVSAFGDSIAGACGYRIQAADGFRSVVITEDGLIEDEGEPIAGEDPIDPEEYDEDSVLDSLELLGLDIADGVESSRRCALLQLKK